MSTTTISRPALPEGAVAVRPEGLLSGVRRPCPEHACECRCVSHDEDGHLLFWCDVGQHHITAG